MREVDGERIGWERDRVMKIDFAFCHLKISHNPFVHFIIPSAVYLKRIFNPLRSISISKLIRVIRLENFNFVDDFHSGISLYKRTSFVFCCVYL